ncbi:hypothetical protein TELCIR_17848, partial [Teladorsagia circumcincta]
DPFLVIPKFDRVAVCLLFYMWWMMCGVASSGGVPKGLYLFNAAILLGLCFPLVSAPCNTLLSEILGPRKQ